MRNLVKLVVAMAVVAGSVGLWTPAQAYCGPTYVEGTSSSSNGCSNSCMDTARAWEKVTGKPAPWLCPM